MIKSALFISLLVPVFSFSQVREWKFLFESDAGTTFYKSNNDRTAWVKVVSEKTEYFPKESYPKAKTINGYTISLWKFDCNEQKMGLVKSTTYSNDGKSVDSFSKNEILVEMDYVNPDSIGEALLNAFCSSRE